MLAAGGCSALLLALSAAPSWAFSAATLMGNCSFSFSESKSDGATNVAVGLYSFDGAGNLIASTSVVSNNGTGETFNDFANIQSGSYTVNGNGTGTLTINSGGADTYNIVIDEVSGGLAKEVRFLSQSSGKAGLSICRFQ
ncbi:MAG TPA: hypothetical protein VJX23_00195 [Candidatus Binataceae bacterium]|nr:hypothetical protein [Candidatus Binataceae bacterium]